MKKVTIIVALILIGILACTPPSEVNTVEVSPETATIAVGATQQFTAVAKDADGNEVEDVDFTWSSSDEAVATIDENGLVTGVAVGTCTITAEAEDKEGSATLTVSGGPTEHSGDITADETWWPSGNPHIIISYVSVKNNATLTIKPGCIVKFESDAELYCGLDGPGSIVAEGTADSVITFTSDAAVPAPGDWASIGIYEDAMSTTSFKHCIFTYGGSNQYEGSFYVEDFGAKISDCTISKSANDGVVLSTDGYFETFEDNTVTECGGYPLYIYPDYVRTIGTGNSFTGNTHDAVLVGDGDVTITGTWADLGVPYVIETDIYIGDDDNNPILTIAPGSTLKFESKVEVYVGFSEPGGLIADGTSGWITFTSATTPSAKGDWACVSFYDFSIDAECMLKSCKIEYAGYNEYGNIYIEDALPEITGDSIGYSKGYGIYLEGTEYPDPTALGNNNTFYENDLGDIYVPSGN